jgi:predicted TPR repeat methyltransferase
MTTPSRNQPCLCGSGKKYKHCCANAQAKGASGAARMPTEPVAGLLDEAVKLHTQGRMHRAEAIYRRILQFHPEHADAGQLLGLVRHQLGDHTTAHALISKALLTQPDNAVFHNNLGEVCRALGCFDEAAEHYVRALSLQADFAEAHRNLGLAYLDGGQSDRAVSHLTETARLFPRQIGSYWALGLAFARRGDPDAALAAFERGLALEPAHPTLLCAKGIALRALGRPELAIEHYVRAIGIQPDVAELHHNLALVYQQQGQREAAIACLERELALRPKAESARHLLAAMRNETTERAPASYVRETFDFYAESFDTHLVDKLEYQTPRLLIELLRDAAPEAHDWNILDLGCGTGLLGEQVLSMKRQLTGVDLSPRMIEKARQRGIYDELIVGDLLEYLAEAPDNRFDLVAAADVFNYLGNLQPVFQKIGRLLVPGGWVCFSIEIASTATADYALDTTGRFQHNSAYLDGLAAQGGLSIFRQTSVCLRKEHGKPVDGLLYLLRKPL